MEKRKQIIRWSTTILECWLVAYNKCCKWEDLLILPSDWAFSCTYYLFSVLKKYRVA